MNGKICRNGLKEEINLHDIDYIVNTSASLSRDVEPVEGTVFCSSATGFSVCSASATDLKFYMLDKDGNVLHVVERKLKK